MICERSNVNNTILADVSFAGLGTCEQLLRRTVEAIVCTCVHTYCPCNYCRFADILK